MRDKAAATGKLTVAKEIQNLVQSSAGEHGFEVERLEAVAVGLEELVLELDPVEAQRVEEALEEIHAEQHSEGDHGEDCIPTIDHDGVARVDHAEHGLLPKHSR
jgi:hypothetical protein